MELTETQVQEVQQVLQALLLLVNVVVTRIFNLDLHLATFMKWVKISQILTKVVQ